MYTTWVIENSKIKKLLEEKNDIVSKWRKLSEEIEELERKRDSLWLLIQKIKDKVIPLIEKEVEWKYPTEFHELSSIDIVDWVVQYKMVDRVELFKESFLELKNKKDDNLDKESEADDQLVKTS